MNCKKTWTSKRLLEVIDFNPKETLRKGQRAKKIAMEQLRPFSKTPMGYCEEFYNGGAKFKNGDTLLARITPCLENGKTAQVNELDEGEVGFGSTEYIVLRAKEGKSDKDFIYYLSISPNFRSIAIKSMVGSSGRQRVQQNVLENAEFLLPDLKTQKKISTVLGSLDNKIELNEKINQNLEAQAQAIFKSWFVDFEPFKNGKFVDSELGKIPEGWRVEKLGQILNIRYGKNLPQTKLKISGYPVYGANGQIGFYSEYMFKSPQVLVSCRGAASGKVNISTKNSFITNNSLILDYTTSKTLSFEYLKYYALRADFSPFVTGSAQPQITIETISSAKILVPNKQIMNKFNLTIFPILNAIFKNNEESCYLSQLRDTLLPKLMSGEIDVSDVAV